MRIVHQRTHLVAVAFCSAGLWALAAVSMTPCRAGTIPAWLDDAVTAYNQKNPGSVFEFVDIKDSFVWYRVPAKSSFGPKELRDAAYRIVQGHGYVTTDEEEMVTTGKPPASTSALKCWRRSFVLTMEKLSNTQAVGANETAGLRQRMLTSLICDGGDYWNAGFRIAD